MLNNRRVAIYCRVANKNDDVMTQHETPLREFAEKIGDTNISVYTDNGFNGTNFNRPAFAQLNADIAAGTISKVIVKDISRISRDVLDTLDWIKNMRRKGIEVISALDNSCDDDFPDTIKSLLGNAGISTKPK